LKEDDYMDEILALYQELHDSLGTNEICDEFCARIIQVIQDAVDAIPSGAKVGIRCADPSAEYLIGAIDFSKTNVIGVFDLEREGSFCGYPLFRAEKLKEMNCNYVIFATYSYRDAVLEELHSFKGTVIDIYDLLRGHGIQLHGPIKFYQAGFPAVLNYFYQRYVEARHKDGEEEALRNFLQAAVEYQDFVMISRVYEENGGDSGKYPFLIKAWEKSRCLLDCIQNKIEERKQNDIIAFWTDSISYLDMDFMPNLKNKSREGCFFEQTYTNCPWTRATMQAILQGILPIDDFSDIRRAIDHTNSPLIRYLENNGYEFRWVSFPTWAIDSSYVVPGIKEGTSSSIIWWLGLQSLLCSERPCFYIFHFLVEGHEPPSLSPDLTRFHFSGPNLHLLWEQIIEQRKVTLAYLDQCLMFYDQLLEGKTRIYFSDHGSYWVNVPDWSEERLRTYCLVLGKGIPKVGVSEFFTFVNFTRLIQWVLEPWENNIYDFVSKAAVFQSEDYYSESIVNAAIKFIKKGYPHNGIAFRGVRTDGCKYVLNALGEECFYIIGENGAETLTPLEDDKLRVELRNKCGTYFIDIRKHDKFKHSQKLYESILHDHPELGEPLWAEEEI